MKLDKPPQYLRTLPAKGIQSQKPVDRQGGDSGAGVIRGYAVITRGEALGHGVWIDEPFLHDVAAQINAAEQGLKSRFTHPGMSSDGLAKFLGRTKHAIVDGDTVRAEIHFSASSHRTPDGDLAGYIMDRAEEDPASFGASIVYEPDSDAEDAFVLAHGGMEQFQSPDPLNTANLPHARLKQLRAVDLVDDPAATSGLFHRPHIASDAEALLAYSLGLSNEKPTETQFGLDADRVQAFIRRFLNRHGLSVVPTSQECPMAKNKHEQPDDEEKPELETDAPEDDDEEHEEPDCDCPEGEDDCHCPDEQPEEQKRKQRAQSTGKHFLTAFGVQGGVWFAEGKSFAEAQALYLSAIKSEVDALKQANDELRKQLSAQRGETSPVSFQAEPTSEERAVQDLTFKVGSPSLARFAAGIKRAK